MKTIYLEHSTGTHRTCDWAAEVDLSERPQRIVVGTGPGSFAGIRAALAFAQGYALGAPGCEVRGLPSACALVEPGDGPLAVVGDARRGLYWVALFESFRLVTGIFLATAEDLPRRVPLGAPVVTPDAARIDAFLKETFGARYRGGRTPTAEGLRRFAEACPAILKPEPLPLYLNPAVRENN